MFELLLALFIGLQAADTTTTLMAFNRGFVEVNPLMPSSPSLLVGIKIGATTGSSLVFIKAHKKHPKAVKRTLVVLNIIYAAVVIHNIKQLQGGGT